MFWVYGPDHKDITIIGLEPHPEDSKNGSYDRINPELFIPIATMQLKAA
jgi:hypothetical protein